MCFRGLTSLNTNQGMEHQNLVYKCSFHHLLIIANCLLISYYDKPSLQILFPQSRRPSSRLLESINYYNHFVKQFDSTSLGLTILRCKITPAPERNDSPCFPAESHFHPGPGIGLGAPALGTPNLSHWTTREVPPPFISVCNSCLSNGTWTKFICHFMSLCHINKLIKAWFLNSNTVTFSSV